MNGWGWMDGWTNRWSPGIPTTLTNILHTHFLPLALLHSSHIPPAHNSSLTGVYVLSAHRPFILCRFPWQAPALSSSLAFWMSGAAACYFSSSAQFSWSISHTVYSLWTWRSGYLPEVHRVDLFQLPLCPKVQYRVCREWVLQKYFKPFYRWGNWGEELEFDTETPLCCSMRFFGCW
jgi:hypothetical protein